MSQDSLIGVPGSELERLKEGCDLICGMIDDIQGEENADTKQQLKDNLEEIKQILTDWKISHEKSRSFKAI